MNQIWMNAVRASARAVAPWWRAGGAPEPVAVYQPIGAASLAASYTNLANPGTFDAVPVVAPTWSAGAGWEFNGIDQYLTTAGIVAQDGWAMIARFSNGAISSTARFLVGNSQGGGATTNFSLVPVRGTADNRIYQQGGFLATGTRVAEGVMAIAGQQGYLNGNPDGGTIAAWSGTNIFQIYIGGANRDNALYEPWIGNIQAVAIYDVTLTAPQVAAVSAAMAAL